ncbi:GntR family transcriptional regulator [Microbacterium resistens]|uniref:GntR family transcriptional regulator n=1 Tax=Microbacterium resistens TaxID=156977 RepID=A0ABY3RW98_9MICO|nr:GntR family transcriptional regulator [Microbacterium resistens]UGS26722.1 GntR family transcriptional regulator [Microbacterium resistens]
MTVEGTWSPQRISFSRNDGLPKYVAIARAITLAITDGELTAGETLPAQKELAESFGVTLMTVRQAIQLLTEQDLLTTEQGKGTYVRSRPFHLPLGRLASLAAQVEASGRRLSTEVLGFAPIEISPLEQQRMGLPAPEAVELVRLRFVDGVPFILQTSLLPPEFARGVEPDELVERSLYDVLQDAHGIRVERAHETVQATSLDDESARLLGRRTGESALLSSRLTFSSDGIPVLDDRALTAGDTVVVSAERHANDGGLSLVLSRDATALADSSLPFMRGSR